MSDICKCINDTCLIRNSCYRYRATASQRQSFAIFTAQDCSHHWDMVECGSVMSPQDSDAFADEVKTTLRELKE